MHYPDDPELALEWNNEVPYPTTSEDQMETSDLSSDKFDHFVFSSKY